jgi:segregation and condensation protein B
LERDQIESIIESLLFVAGEPVSLKRMTDIVGDVERAEVRAALEELQRRCEGPERGLRIVEVAGGYQLQTPADNAPWVGRLLQTRPIRLSRASIETLAIVAYRQPLTKAEVDEIRGVDSGGVLKTLLEYGFIRIAGRKDVPGKPLIYATDKRFMEFFRLKSLADLPTLREMEEIQEERLAEAQEAGVLPLEDGAEYGETEEPGDAQAEGEADEAAENFEDPGPEDETPGDEGEAGDSPSEPDPGPEGGTENDEEQ